MIGGIAIAAGLLAVLDEGNEDFEELFQRAMLLGDRQVLLSRLDDEEEKDFLRKIKKMAARCPEDQRAFWQKTLDLFVWDYQRMLDECCPSCEGVETQERWDLSRGMVDDLHGAMCGECGHVEFDHEP